jgi:aspartyl-tRNA(Asn)/glutamyl-tRNA(Gln) amidotransferase subunit A
LDILNQPATDIAALVKQKKISAKEVTSAFLKQTEKLNPSINAFITINDKALQEAEKVDARIAKGEDVGLLAGVPIAIKDMLCTKGLRTTAASKMLFNFIPPYSATVVNRLEGAGAITIGKANQDEFAMGSSNETSHFGGVKNPWNSDYVPGGSSGGSAAAVAARMAPIAIGTDTGGSIRQPSSFCGLVGVKPTYGRVSRYGIVAFASSLDQAGPMTLNVKDAATTLEVISGKCNYDSTTSTKPVPKWSQNLNSDLKGMKIGLPKEYFSDAVRADVRKIVENATQIAKSAGAEIVEVSLPLTRVGVPVYYLVSTCEASSNLSRYDGVRFGYRADFSKHAAEDIADFYARSRGEGFGLEVKRRIMLGTFALSSGYYDAYYKKACQVRRLLREDFVKAFSKCDVIMGPVFTTPAFKVGEKINNPLQMYMNDIYTVSANLAGIPGMSVPGGYSQEGLPVGIQINAAHFEEQKMLNVAYAIEKALQLKEVPNGIR